MIFLMLEEKICAELRGRHRELWKAIGSPEKVFDDGGMTRWIALGKLRNSPELLRECRGELVRMIKVRDLLGSLIFGFCGIAVVVVIVVDYFGII